MLSEHFCGSFIKMFWVTSFNYTDFSLGFGRPYYRKSLNHDCRWWTYETIGETEGLFYLRFLSGTVSTSISGRKRSSHRSWFEKFRQMFRKITMPESYLDKVPDLQLAILSKIKLQNSFYPISFVKFLRRSCLQKTWLRSSNICFTENLPLTYLRLILPCTSVDLCRKSFDCFLIYYGNISLHRILTWRQSSAKLL